VNHELTLDFDERGEVVPGHFGFLVDDDTFDQVLARLRARPDVPFGAGPEHGWDRTVNRVAGGRGVYVRDPDGHSYEFFTAVPA
jgi:catechol 2,3-dioxygenase-like lactoylglutathione lyase family enzyme